MRALVTSQRSLMSVSRGLAALAAAGVLAFPSAPLLAQEPATPSVRWWHGAIVVGGLGMLMLVDDPVSQALQGDPPSTTGFAGVAKRMGQPEVYLTVTAGVVLTGLVADRPKVVRAGGRIAASLALAGAATNVAKVGLGRGRPNEGFDADDWSPLSGRTSMPSGHTAMAFALATAVSDEVDNPFVSVVLYAGATATAWSRVYQHRHWVSDVAAGAAVGILSAKLAGGRWRVFGLRAPRVLVGRSGAALAWQAEF